MNSSTHPLRSRRGFTLIEILLATAVAAIVLIAIQSVFFGALKLRNTTTERIETDLVLQRALGIMRKDISGIVVPGTGLAGELQSVPASALSQDTINGERISPDFYTTSGKIDGWTPFSEMQLVAYYLRNETTSNGSKSLVRVITRNLLPVQSATQEEQILIGGIAEASIEFYDGTSWTDTWDSTSTSTLPTAIRFNLTLAGQQGQNQINNAPVELLVPVLVSTKASQTSTSTSSGS